MQELKFDQLNPKFDQFEATNIIRTIRTLTKQQLERFHVKNIYMNPQNHDLNNISISGTGGSIQEQRWEAAFQIRVMKNDLSDEEEGSKEEGSKGSDEEEDEEEGQISDLMEDKVEGYLMKNVLKVVER